MSTERYRGALLGVAAGDAVGTTVEFSAPGSFEPLTDMVGGGPFRLPVGAWTDDTSMALCLAESLVERGGFDPVDQLERYLRWYREGHLSSTGSCFDIGVATRASLERFERSRDPYPGDAYPQAGGNGSLMRLAPVALAYAHDPESAVEYASLSSRTTHGAPQAHDACRYLAALLVGALRGAGTEELLAPAPYEPTPGLWGREPLHPEVREVAEGSFLRRRPPTIKGGGYAVRALEAALWALAETDTFEAGVLAAANLGDDADTTAAILGQLAGACYGADAIPARWRERLIMKERITELADGLFALATAGDLTGPRTRGQGLGRKVAGSGEAGRPARVTPVPHAPSPAAAPEAASDASLPGDSYWVIEGRVLGGPFPGAKSMADAERKLDAFLDLGVTCFIDLTEEGEGPPLHPYASLLRRLARRRKARATYLRLSVLDLGIPAEWQMRSILSAIGFALAADEVVYIHCWGGVGRTGTVVGCLLVEQGMSTEGALARIAGLRSGTERAARVSPETAQQREFIEAWSGIRRGAAIPGADAGWEQISAYAHLYNGYAHFGDDWANPFHQVRERWERTGELPDDLDDLRALLFLEFRSDRFNWGDDVVLSDPDEQGVRHIVANPDYESTPSACYRRAIVGRLRELAAPGTS